MTGLRQPCGQCGRVWCRRARTPRITPAEHLYPVFALLDQLFEFPVDRVEPGFDLRILGVIAGGRE